MFVGVSLRRLAVLIALLLIEAALVVSLRNWGWNATGNAIGVATVSAAVIVPFMMALVLLYGSRARLKRGQFTIRAAMAMTLIVAWLLALFAFVWESKLQDVGPLPVASNVLFEVYKESSTPSDSTKSHIDPATQSVVYTEDLPVITIADVALVEFQPGGDPSSGARIIFTLTPAGGTEINQASQNAGAFVFTIDGRVIAIPKVRVPIGSTFELSVGDLDQTWQVFMELTGRRRGLVENEGK